MQNQYQNKLCPFYSRFNCQCRPTTFAIELFKKYDTIKGFDYLFKIKVKINKTKIFKKSVFMSVIVCSHNIRYKQTELPLLSLAYFS